MKFFNLAHSLFVCFLFSLSFAFGQSTTITGNVYDGATGTPLSNYTVTSSQGGSTTTNASGFYTLVVPSTSDFHVILAAQNSKCYREKWTWGRKVLDFHLTACNYDRNRDSIALRSLYDNLNGAAWTNPWNIAQPITSWGLAYNTRGAGPIEFVGLDNRNLNGTFPTAATGFSNLRDLFGFQFVGNTNLRGTLPSLTNMKQLDWVKIQESGMSGDPLSSIAGLKNIEFLRLTFNTSMSMTFPATINTDWRNIYNLQLEGINLSGTIPTALFALPNLQTVGLGQNKLTGTVPSLASGNSSTIKFLILNDNDLDSVPNLSISTNLTALGVKGNKLTFDDIVPNISKFNAATVYEGSANSFVYAPQDSFFVDTTIRVVENTPLSIDLKIDGALTSNVYTWTKNVLLLVATTTTTTNKLVFPSVGLIHAGVWTCEVTNPNAPLLTLYSRKITIQVSPAATTCRMRDSLALVDLYNATGGANWTNKWVLNLPMTTWYGVTLNTQGCVEQLNLFNNNLTGNSGIPNLNLQNLRILRLQDNNISGAIPSFTNMTLLDTVHFGGNRFTSLGNQTMMPNLTHLDLSRNTISGSMPTLNLPKLKDLFLGVNQFSGALPNYQNLPVLVKYHAQNNNLSGVVPVLTAMPNIRELQLEENAFDSLQRPPQASQAISVVWLKGNSLTFDDLLPYPTSNLTSLTGWTYAPQDSFFVDTIINAIVGAPLSINLKIDGALTTNSYKWFKNGVQQSTSTINKLIINSLQASDAGAWTCQVTNTTAPLLTLYSRKITIQVSPAATTCRTRDSLALVDLYNATNGANWTNKWILTQPMTTWFGVTLNAQGCVSCVDLDGVVGCSYSLNASGNNLVGTLPTSLDSLQNLTGLFLSYNTLSGTVPNLKLPLLDALSLTFNRFTGSIPNFNALPNLFILYLSGNQLTGTVPNFNLLPKLTYLELYQNQLTGSIPAFSLPLLRTLHLYSNQLTGTIPNFTLPDMRVINISGNQITGTIPNFNFPNLEILFLSDNRLTGSIPSFNYPNLKTLLLRNNQLSGCIPATIKTNSPLIGVVGGDVSANTGLNTQSWANYWNTGEGACAIPSTCRSRDSLALVELFNKTRGAGWTVRNSNGKQSPWNLNQPMTTWYGVNINNNGCVDTLFLNSNNLFGTIPTTIDSLSALIVLGLGMNRISGTIPPTLGNMTTLKHLDLAVNNLNGTIPASLGNLRQMQKLYLGGNGLTGTIPSSFGNFTQIIELMLNKNNLTGTIPNELGNLTNVQKLLLNENGLTGTIPTSFGNLQRVEHLYLYKNQLSGSIPTEIGNLTTLIVLALEENALTGVVPQSLRNLTNLQGLGLRKNLFDSIPKLSNLPLTDSILLDNNKLTFDDIIPIVKPKTTYAPQDSFFLETTLNGTIGSPLSIDLKIDGDLVTNQYRWYKNGVFSRTSLTNKFVFSSLQATDAGVWTCQVINPTAPLLTLYSRKITIQVGCVSATTGQPVTKNVCAGQTYTSPSGRVFSISGTYNDTIKNINNCDSIVYILNLAVSPNATNQTLTPSVCTTFRSPSGKTLSATGTYRDTAKTINGCDSVFYSINLTVQNTVTRQTINPTICPNQTYRSPSGKIFSTAGTKFDTLKNQSGCDSVSFTINLKIQTPQYQQATTQSICKNDVYRGIILTRDTAFIDTLRSVGLCDSVITTTPIKVNNASVNNLNLSLCVGGSVTVNGIVYNAAKRTGQQILTAASTTGCDSIINISTTFVSNLSAIDDDFTIRDSTNTLIFNVLTNDVFSGIVKTTPLSKPGTGRLDTLGAGRFTYSVPPQANGTTSFDYRLCSVGCPNVCDTATVRIAIMRPRLNTDVSIGITPNCGCPNEKLLFPELELNPDKFPNNELVIISRWGDVVYRAKPYKNDWTGANENNENLPAGTYYYIMRLDLANSKIKTGDVTIYRQ